MAGTTGTAGYSGGGGTMTGLSPATMAALTTPRKGPRTLNKQQRAARERRKYILQALGWTGSTDLRVLKREHPEIVAGLKKAPGAFSGGPSVRQRAGTVDHPGGSIRSDVVNPASPGGSSTTLASLLSGGSADVIKTPDMKVQYKKKRPKSGGVPMTVGDLKALGLF